jgi:CelD/BcsL family acetyltransferase involved in cellulose biosynthesis
MIQATQAALDARGDIEFDTAQDAPRAPAAVAQRTDVRLSIHDDLSTIERDWRAFEQHADCTVFQTFDWISAWHRNVGIRAGVMPVVVVGRDADGKILLLLPLAIAAGGFVRRLTWLGSELCDYNAPLIAEDFSRRVSPARFHQVWRDIVKRLQSHPRLSYDLIHFEKMPEKIGAQTNPMLGFPVAMHPSGAYLTHLSGDWETYYTAKRSSATRRSDRAKRKRLSESGEVRFVNPEGTDEIAATLDTLMHQKARSFADMGVANIFARPGHPEFYRQLATTKRDLVHVSRLDVGSTIAAVNLGLTFRGCYYHVLASYDDGELSRFGPGTAHLHDLMRYAIDRGCRVFDFTVGDERYKRDWSDTELKLFDHVSIATARGAVAAVPLLAARQLKRWIKHIPVVWSAFTRARALVGSMRARA